MDREKISGDGCVHPEDAAHDRGFRAGVRQALGEIMDADTVGEARKALLKLLDAP